MPDGFRERPCKTTGVRASVLLVILGKSCGGYKVLVGPFSLFWPSTTEPPVENDTAAVNGPRPTATALPGGDLSLMVVRARVIASLSLPRKTSAFPISQLAALIDTPPANQPRLIAFSKLFETVESVDAYAFAYFIRSDALFLDAGQLLGRRVRRQ